MKKKTFIVFIAVVGIFAIVNYLHIFYSDTAECSLLMANVEALSQDETNVPNGSVAEVKETRTYTEYKTTSPGWSWSVGVGWLFHGEVSKKRLLATPAKSLPKKLHTNVVVWVALKNAPFRLVNRI